MDKMFSQPLNLPPFDIAMKRTAPDEIRIFDSLRQKWLVSTPEEWVRQHFVHYLLVHLNYPAAFVANEVGLTLNSTRRRCDTVVYTRSLKPLCVVEYKRPSVEINASVFDQIARYNSVLGARFLMVSNGMKHYCCRFNGDGYEFLKTIPSYDEMSSVGNR